MSRGLPTKKVVRAVDMSNLTPADAVVLTMIAGAIMRHTVLVDLVHRRGTPGWDECFARHMRFIRRWYATYMGVSFPDKLDADVLHHQVPGRA
jgi:hypothetical protein